jgi:hypothetical protein
MAKQFKRSIIEMSKFFKSLSVVTAAATVAFGASVAEAAQFNVVVDKIEVMRDGGANDRFVVYQPSAGIGETATRSIDLFNASQKAGTALTIAPPPAGTYTTMLVTFGNITIGDDAGNVSNTLNTTLEGLGVLGNELGRSVLILGDDGDGVGGTADIADLVGAGSAAPIQSIVSGGAGSIVALPSLNFFLPSDGSGVDEQTGALLANPVFIPTLSQSVDRANLPNVVVGVKESGFINTEAAIAGNFVYRVGLFRSALDKRPVVSRAVTFASKTDHDELGIQEVRFLDVPEGTYIPVAWIDANSNGLWDEGELTVVANGTIADISFTVDYDAVGLIEDGVAKTISTTYVSGVSATVDNAVSASLFEGGANIATDLTDGFIGEAASFTMPARGVRVDLEIQDQPNLTTEWVNNGLNGLSGLKGTLGTLAAPLDAAAGAVEGAAQILIQLTGGQAAANASVTRVVNVDVRYGADGQTLDGSTNGELGTGELAFLALDDDWVGPSDFSYDEDDAIMSFNVPFLSISGLGTSLTGTYRFGFNAAIGAADVTGSVPTFVCDSAVPSGCDTNTPAAVAQVVTIDNGAQVTIDTINE